MEIIIRKEDGNIQTIKIEETDSVIITALKGYIVIAQTTYGYIMGDNTLTITKEKNYIK